jgi:hypothetical protein
MSPRHGVEFVVEVDGEAHKCTMVHWCDDVKGGGFKRRKEIEEAVSSRRVGILPTFSIAR